MLPISGFENFCGATFRGGRYYSMGVGGGHGDSFDDAMYEFDTQTNTWSTPVASSTTGNSSATHDTFGEWTSGPSGRPASQHSYAHLVSVGNDVIQGHGYAISFAATGSKQAHIWRQSSGVWERYGSTSGSIATGNAHCLYDSSRNRIWRFSCIGNNNAVDYISSTLATGDSSTAWSSASWSFGAVIPIIQRTGSSDLYVGIGYYPPLDCFVAVNPYDFYPSTQRTFIMDAATPTAGWTEVSTSGTGMPDGSDWMAMEYIPTLPAMAMASRAEAGNLYYLKPTGAATAPWVWSKETFSGSPAAWAATGIYNRLKWSSTLHGLVCIKNYSSPIEVFYPSGA
jgi:hypothetical protein